MIFIISLCILVSANSQSCSHEFIDAYKPVASKDGDFIIAGIFNVGKVIA